VESEVGKVVAVLARLYSTRPSQILGEDDPLEAFLLDLSLATVVGEEEKPLSLAEEIRLKRRGWKKWREIW